MESLNSYGIIIGFAAYALWKIVSFLFSFGLSYLVLKHMRGEEECDKRECPGDCDHCHENEEDEDERSD